MFHLTDQGPMHCSATVRACPLGGLNSETLAEAQELYEEQMEREFGAAESYVTLQGAFGPVHARDGDLSNIGARIALTTGLCGDLAAAIQKRTGGQGYFVCYDISQDELEQLDDVEDLVVVATHALVGSNTAPGEFMDAYGRKTLKDLKEFYGGDIEVLKASPEQIKAYSAERQSNKLNGFVEAVLRLDAAGESYDYQGWGD